MVDPDCTRCEAPCCRRQFMEDDDGPLSLRAIRRIYRSAGTDVRVIRWVEVDGGRQPQLACDAFDTSGLGCGVYERRPEHCRAYDCRDDEAAYADAENWAARAHCLLPTA